MAGTLYIVATPIGNLEDLSPRAAATLGMVDFIAAEDTRVTLRLLNHLGLKKPMLSYYQHNFSKGDQILARLEAGENCALCSDAGMPAISDPGELLVKDALARNIPVCPIPGPSASVSAMVSPSSVLTGVSSASDSAISKSASGTDRPCSHLETVCRTTFSFTASSCWDRPLAFRAPLMFSWSIRAHLLSRLLPPW